MYLSTQFFTIFISLFLCLLVYYSLIKVIRTAILSTNRWLNIDDINIIFIVSIVLALILSQPFDLIKYLTIGFLLIYWLLLWIDAIIFYLFSFEINKSNIKEFFNDYKSMFHYSSRSIELLNRYPWILIVLPLSFTAIFLIFFNEGKPFAISVILPVILTFSIYILQKYRQAIIRNVLVLTAVVLIVIILEPLISMIWDQSQSIISGISILMILGFIFINIFKGQIKLPFFNLKSHLRKFLRDEKLVYDPSILIKEDHKHLIDSNPIQVCRPSKYFGLLKNANVIFVTIESLGKKYLNKTMSLPFYDNISSDSIVSNNHYAISPHTNQFLYHLYNSEYRSNSSFPLHKLLRNNHYNTAFISSADLNICETRGLIHQIGFDEIIDKNELYPMKGSRGDYLLLDAIPRMFKILQDSPCFIQILTVQSHYPYDTYNKKKFKSKIGTDLKTKYLSTVQETDYILDMLFSELSKVLDLDNTLIVYTGDHGESFGELGYKAHSNSTINAQLLTPFFLKHKNLQLEEIEHSTTFDILPTILDLLGININVPIYGNSIFSENRYLPNLFYSMVKKGNAPANVKFRLKDKNIMIDRVLDYYMEIDEEDQIVRNLDKQERLYYSSLIYKMMDIRGLLN